MSFDPRNLRFSQLETENASFKQTVATLHETVTVLLARIEDLEDRLNRNSSNSSTPPSANPPGAPKSASKKPSGRMPGGQPGHKGLTGPWLITLTVSSRICPAPVGIATPTSTATRA